MECGQKTTVKRINLREGWNDFWSRVYGFYGVFPRTLRDLTIRPGHATREFLNGNRVKYYGPVGYFFFLISLYLLVMSMLGITAEEIGKATVGALAKPGSSQDQFNSNLFNWMTENQRIGAFLMIPFYALGAKMFFRRERLNFLEHSVLIFYTQGHVQWLSIFGLFSFVLVGYFPSFYFLLILQVLYYAYACVQLYQTYRPWAAFMRGVLVNLFFFGFFIILTTVAIIIAFIVNPELMEQLRPSNN